MDSREVKAAYGDRLALLGNIEIGETLTLGTPADVEAEVRAAHPHAGARRRLRRWLEQHGGALRAAASNFKAMVRATRAYGRYPIAGIDQPRRHGVR